MKVSLVARRRRPAQVRYFGLLVTDKDIRHWSTHDGLTKTARKHKVKDLVIADTVAGVVYVSPKPLEDFLEKWGDNYNDPTWDYRDTF